MGARPGKGAGDPTWPQAVQLLPGKRGAQSPPVTVGWLRIRFVRWDVATRVPWWVQSPGLGMPCNFAFVLPEQGPETALCETWSRQPPERGPVGENRGPRQPGTNCP